MSSYPIIKRLRYNRAQQLSEEFQMGAVRFYSIIQ